MGWSASTMPNGQRQLEAHWSEGQLHGTWTLWYKNGSLCQYGSMQRGARNDAWFRCDRQGRLVAFNTYQAGRLWGQQVYHTASGPVQVNVNAVERQRNARNAMERQRDKLRSALASAQGDDKVKLEHKLGRLEQMLKL